MEDYAFLGRPLVSWIIAGILFVVIAFGVPILRRFVRRRFPAVEGDERSVQTLIAHLNGRWLRLTTLVLALVPAAFLLAPSARLAYVAQIVVVAMLAIQLFRLVSPLVDWAIARAAGATDPETGSPHAASTLRSLRWVALLVVYSLVFLLALQNMGVNVTALIAGLGIGGIAVALAAQNILGDLFGSLTIALDKPFVVGDFIVVGSEMGTVEHVGLKTTRVRSLGGEQLVFANTDLLGSRIRNYKRMQQRRVVFSFGVVYGTEPAILQQIPAIVRGIIESVQGLRYDRCHFHRFGESSLDFETVYHIDTADYNKHMDALQAVHLGMAFEFRKHGIDFAFPTRTLYFEGENARALAGRPRWQDDGEPAPRHRNGDDRPQRLDAAAPQHQPMGPQTAPTHPDGHSPRGHR